MTHRIQKLLAWFLLGLAACSSQSQNRAATARRPVAPDEDLIGLVPLGSDLLLESDARRLLAWGPVAKWAAGLAPATRESLASSFGFDPLKDADHLVAATSRTPEVDLLVLVRGRLDPGQIEAAALGRGGKQADHRGVRLWESASGAVALLTGRTVVLGSRATVRRAIDVMRQVHPSVRQASDMMALWQSRKGPAQPLARVASVVSEPMRRDLGRELGLTADLRTFAAEVAQPDFNLLFEGELGSPAQASDWAGRLRTQKDELRSRLAIFGLGSYLDGFRVSAEQTRVLAQLHLTEQQLGEILSLLSRFIESGDLPLFKKPS